MTLAISILLGLAGGAVLTWALRGTSGRVRSRRALFTALPILAVLLAWALWRDAFPATFGPFVVVCLITSVAGRADTANRS